MSTGRGLSPWPALPAPAESHVKYAKGMGKSIAFDMDFDACYGVEHELKDTLSSECNPLPGRLANMETPMEPVPRANPKHISYLCPLKRHHPLYQTTSAATFGARREGDQAARLGRTTTFTEEFRAGRANDPSIPLVMHR